MIRRADGDDVPGAAWCSPVRGPLWWSCRPTAWPPWTYRDRQVARFWSASSGVDDEAIDALRTGRPLTVVEPAREELLDQLAIELAAAKTHLRSILDQYWNQEWRRANRHDTSPEDQLWRAAMAATELEAAIDEQRN